MQGWAKPEGRQVKCLVPSRGLSWMDCCGRLPRADRRRRIGRTRSGLQSEASTSQSPVQHGAQGPSVLCAANDRQRGHSDRDPRCRRRARTSSCSARRSSETNHVRQRQQPIREQDQPDDKLGYPFTNNFSPEVTAERGCLSRVRSLLSPFAAISIALRRERILGVCSYH